MNIYTYSNVFIIFLAIAAKCIHHILGSVSPEPLSIVHHTSGTNFHLMLGTLLDLVFLNQCWRLIFLNKLFTLNVCVFCYYWCSLSNSLYILYTYRLFVYAFLPLCVLIVYYKHYLCMGSSAKVLLIIILMNLLWYFRAFYRIICVLVVIFQCF